MFDVVELGGVVVEIVYAQVQEKKTGRDLTKPKIR